MLTSLQNPLVKQLRKLHRAKERRDQGLFLLEGSHLLEEACTADYPLSVVCYTPNWRDRHPDLWARLSQRTPRFEEVSEAVLEAIATTVSPDGVVAAASYRAVSPGLNHSLSLGLALEALQDPGNLGTIIRTAAAANVEGIWLSADSVDLEHPKVLRATAGQWFHLPMAVSSDLDAELRQCKANGVQIVATLPTASQTYWQADLRKPTVIALGNEGSGLSAELTALSDVQVRIPLAEGVESLNVAVAAALILYEAFRQRSQGQG